MSKQVDAEQLDAHKSSVDYENLGESIQWYNQFTLGSDDDEQEF